MDFGRREAPLAPYVRYLVKKVKETGILIDKPKREKPKTQHKPENIAAVAESASHTLVININSPAFSTIEHFGHIIEANISEIFWYDAIQSSIGSGVEAN